ncbi:serine/threonine-protein kinase, active site protein [Artemisia annua]|uniref:Serine/threonine-protein kinase, active site protein n=1 Tax=Artemisia annua TaxID=35608 RepID=A0A2U1NLC9_ARTAN|nr:serine/threonine-protein kinase, active site protein [Artemisia annua]
MEKKKTYSTNVDDYVLYEEVGQGVSASVYRAMCIPFNEIVAIKVLDFERGSSDLNNISRESQTMILVDHPNVLKSHCSFVKEHNLWVVMPFMPGGSCLHILKSAHPEGFEEVVIATILREVLKALVYLHHHGLIHRDVKAGNILISEGGGIRLGDLGVSACLFDNGDRQRMRNTFVGTPCWMAPEVMEQLNGYDFKADIWSFGITALELAHGHAPFSKYPPMKVLLMTLQNAPPGLDYERDKKFSKSFKQMIASCLVKDPNKRPTARKLLKHSFFKQAKSNEFIVRKLLDGLPAIGDRLQLLKQKEEDMLVQKKMPDGQKEEMSQNEYKRGISSWNFDLADLKAQASLIQDEESVSDKDQPGNLNSVDGTGAGERELSHQPSYMSETSKATDGAGSAPIVNTTASSSGGKCEISTNGYLSSQNSSPLSSQSSSPLSSENSSPRADNCNKNDFAGKQILNGNGKSFNGVASHFHQGESSSVCTTVNGFSKLQGPAVVPSSNGSQSLQMSEAGTSESMSKASKTLTSDEQDEKAKGQVIQQKGRFKITSENADNKGGSSPVLLKSPSMRLIIEHPNGSQLSQGEAMSMPQNQTNHLPPTGQQTNNLQRNGSVSSMKQPSTGDTTASSSSTDVGSTSASTSRPEGSKVCICPNQL